MGDHAETPFFKCKTCSTAFSGVIPYRDHMKSKKHAENVKKKNFESEVDKEALNVELTATGDEDDTTPKKKNPFKCDDCNMEFSGPIPYMQHVNGHIHYRVMRNKILTETAMELAASAQTSIPHNAKETTNEKTMTDEQDSAESEDQHNKEEESGIHKAAVNDDESAPPIKATAKISPSAKSQKAEALVASLPSNHNDEPQELKLNRGDLRCELCNAKSFMSIHDMMLHFESDAHRFNRVQQQAMRMKNMSINEHRVSTSSDDDSSIVNIDSAEIAE